MWGVLVLFLILGEKLPSHHQVGHSLWGFPRRPDEIEGVPFYSYFVTYFCHEGVLDFY